MDEKLPGGSDGNYSNMDMFGVCLLDAKHLVQKILVKRGRSGRYFIGLLFRPCPSV